MADNKYIIVKKLGHPVCILFSSLITHDEFLQCFVKENIISAGFFAAFPDKENNDKCNVSVWGRSTSLGIKRRPEDVAIIERFINE